MICLSRAKSHADSLARIKQSLENRQRSLSADEEAKIESFAADVNKDQLGLTPAEYAKLLAESTAVIHVRFYPPKLLPSSLNIINYTAECLAREFCTRD